MNRFTKQETFDPYDRFPDYEEIRAEQIKTRTITEREYQAVHFSYKSKLNSIFTISGLLLILFSLVAVWSITLGICDIVKGEPDAWLYLFICGAVNFFAIAMTGTVYSERRKQVITKDQQISPGEIVHIVLKRGIRKVVLGAYHTIALHGGKQMITIYSPRVIKKGNTVLVVTNCNTTSPYMICVPNHAVDYRFITSNIEYPELFADPSEYIDYTMADLEDVTDPMTPWENAKINLKERLLGPFKYGAISAIWVFFTIVTIIMIVILIKSFLDRNAEVFFPLLMGFICELIIERVICKGVIKKKVSTPDSGILECVVAEKNSFGQNNTKYVRVVIPERKQFVKLNVTPLDYQRLSLNQRVTLVVKKSTCEVRWIIRK